MRGADIGLREEWGAMLTAKDETDGAEIAKKYTDWITDERRIGMGRPRTPSTCIRSPRSGVEVADAVIDGPLGRLPTRAGTGSTPRRR